MTDTAIDPRDETPIEGEAFHAGERAMQARFAVRARVAPNGVRAIRPALSEAHAEFLPTLTYVAVGASDDEGHIWATLLMGPQGFASPLGDGAVAIAARPAPDDPVAAALSPGNALGLLGIDLAARRRIRVNGPLAALDETGFVLAVAQSYNNCPQYIWPRAAEQPGPRRAGGDASRDNLSAIPAQWPKTVQRIVEQADTFFIASRHRADRNDPGARQDSVDVSHRGGRPGFLQTETDALAWPEYRGNWYFNTLGNLLLDPACGLLIPDFSTGNVLQLTGRAIIQPPQAAGDPLNDGLEVTCGVRFVPERLILRQQALPAWRLVERARTRDVEL